MGHVSLNATMARVASDRAREYGVADRVVALSALGEDMDEWVVQHAWNERRPGPR